MSPDIVLTDFQKKQQKRDRKSLEDRQRRARMVDAVRSVLQRTDRIVTGHSDLDVILKDPGYSINAPSWTDGASVFLNREQINRDLDDPKTDMTKFVVRWKGANYHEVCHIVLSPRMNDPLVIWLKEKVRKDNDQRWWYSYNALEDQRIESQYSALYSPTKPYFTQAILGFILGDTAAMSRNHPLIHGRKYLSAKLRKAVRDPFVKQFGEQLADDFAAVIDEYITLVLPRDEMKARKLIELYYKLLTTSKVGQGVGRLPCGNNNGGLSVPAEKKDGQDSSGVPTKGKPRLSEQKRAAKKVAEAMEAEAEGDDPGEGDGEGAESHEGESDDADGSIGAGPAKTTPTPVRDGQGREQDLPEGESAKEFGEKPDFSTQDILDAVQKAESQARTEAAQIESDPVLATDVDDTMKSIRAASKAEGNVSTANYGHHRLESAKTESLKLAREIERIIRSIQLDLEPQWLHGEPTGRLNLDRWFMRKADPGLVDIFDQWEEGGEDEAGIECVILLDLSYSMSGQIVSASRALWAIKRAFDDVGIRTTVIGFSDAQIVLYQPTDKAPRGQTPLFSVIGGTHPNGALREAYNILSRSQEPNRLLFAITDGTWGGDVKEQDTIIGALRKSGVVTTLIAIGHNTLTWGGGHNMDVAMSVEKVAELPSIITEAVKVLLKRVVMH